MKIGIVADTHDRVLPSLYDALAGVDEILHAGDVCRADVLAELEAIAPVLAVHGNCDARALVERLPAERRLVREGVVIHVVHGHRAGRGDVDGIARLAGVVEADAAGSRRKPARGAPDLVVFGHSHEPCDEVRGRTRFFNPGTAGGVGRSPSVGILTITDGRIALEHVPLPR
jgi:putative phosphoesterase